MPLMLLKVMIDQWRLRHSPGPAEMSEADEAAIRERFAEMPHRRLSNWTHITLIIHSKGTPRFEREWGPVRSVTISLVPPEHAHRLDQTNRCPICGAKVRPPDRIAANLSPTWGNGTSLGFGVSVHLACFEACPDAGMPAPVPW